MDRNRLGIPWKCSQLTETVATALVVAFVLAGCQQPTAQKEPSKLGQPSAKAISAYELGRQLGLSVAQVDPTFIKLKDSSNVVMIFTYTDAKFYVNGKAVGPVGKLDKVGTTIYLELSLVSRIKPCLITGHQASKVLTDSRRPTLGTIVIDPGHGGKDPGAISALGFREKTINLDVARQLASILGQRGFRTILTREGDVFMELEDRAAVPNRHNADLFVSIHADSSESRGLNGFTVYTARGAGSQSRWAARAIVDAMTSTGLDSNGIKEADYRVLVHTDCPAVLVELGYISNSWEARKLRDPSMQRRLAQAIADGVVRSMGK